MSIIRVRKDARYFSASNEPFNDIRLSWETRGLMGYLLSKPDQWTIHLKDLLKKGPAGETKIRRMLAEARLYGYMNRIRITQPDKTFEWITEVFESPSLNPNPSKDIIKVSSGVFSTSGSPTSGKPRHILSTEESSTEESIEEEPLAQISKAYKNEIGSITAMIADDLKDASVTYPLKWVLDAIHEAAKNNARNWKYVAAILKRWKAQGNQEPMKAKANGKHPPLNKNSEAPADDGFMSELAEKQKRIRAQMQGAR